MPDTIFIQAMRRQARIGCLAWEKTKTQMISLDIELDYDATAASQSDDIKQALSYADVVIEVEQLLEAKHYELVEHLAECICQHLIKTFTVTEVRLRLAKPNIIRQVEQVGIKMTRSPAAYE